MNLRDYLEKAKKEKWAIGQFNFSTLEQLRGILAAAQKMKSPVILGTSEGESKFLGLKETMALLEISKTNYKVPAFLNLDHAKNTDYIKEAANYGYSSVHFDGSDLSFEKNIEGAKKLVAFIRKKGVLIEGEIDDIQKGSFTDPEQAKEFIEKTRIDSLAIAIGSVHACYEDIRLDFERLREIRNKTDSFLVLHGGSGVPGEQIKKAIKLGINKVNINTELRKTWSQEIKKEILGGEIKPYKILIKVQGAVQQKVEEKIKIFGSFNKI